MVVVGINIIEIRTLNNPFKIDILDREKNVTEMNFTTLVVIDYILKNTMKSLVRETLMSSKEVPFMTQLNITMSTITTDNRKDMMVKIILKIILETLPILKMIL